ncbi:MAG: beta-methylgalactoside transporter [Oscillospiraceae bacterium]|nr:beta-methylgalactoside transporter [Oscillospiraceae bacterium]
MNTNTKISLLEHLKNMHQEYKNLPKKEKRDFWVNFILNNAIIIIFLIFIIYVWIYCYVTAGDNFLSLNSIVNLIDRTAFSCFLALGVAGVIVLTGTDLSAGRALGFIACITASLLQKSGLANKMWPNLSPPSVLLIFLLAIAIGAVIGVFNGFFTAKFKMHPFIATLGSQLILSGLTLMYLNMGKNGGVTISGIDQRYFDAVNSTKYFGLVLPFPHYVLYAVIAIFITWFMWNKTTLGKNMYAVGANPDAATVSGVSVFWTTVLLFIFAGIMYGVSGFVDSARVGSNNASTGVGYELNAIAACVIGGVSFTGGVGKVRGILIGVLLLQLVTVGLQWVKMAPYFQSIITGFIILFAVAVDMRKYIAKK